MIFVLKNVDGKNVTIHHENLASILETLYFEYDGLTAEDFIYWIKYGCEDADDDECDDED